MEGLIIVNPKYTVGDITSYIGISSCFFLPLEHSITLSSPNIYIWLLKLIWGTSYLVLVTINGNVLGWMYSTGVDSQITFSRLLIILLEISSVISWRNIALLNNLVHPLSSVVSPHSVYLIIFRYFWSRHVFNYSF